MPWGFGKQKPPLSKPLNARELWDACGYGEIEKVKAHGALGGDLNLRHGNDNSTGLMGAAMGGKRDVVEWLVRAPGIEIDAQNDSGGNTALHIAAAWGKADCVLVLLEAGASALLKDTHGKTALELARERNKSEVVAVMQQHAAAHSPPSVLSTMPLSKLLNAYGLWSACYDGEIEKVKAHGALGGDLNLRYGGDNMTGLMGAAENGQRDVVEWLVRAPGIEIDAQRDDGWTALHYAALYGKADCALVLLEAGASALLKLSDGRTALELAQAENKSEVVAVMQQHAAAPPAPQPE
eukprot:COSAG02_NODE_8478_length_2556_cov_98.660969_1_plen_294_part_10